MTQALRRIDPIDPLNSSPEGSLTMPVTAHVDRFALENLPPESEWPEFRFELPEYQYPLHMNCATALLDAKVSAGYGERHAVGMMVEGKPVFATYAQLLAQSNRIANFLVRDMKLVPGNRVLVRAPNNPMMAAIWLAIMKAGLIAVPTMPLLRAKELKQTIDKAQIHAAICDARLADELTFCMDPVHASYTALLTQIVYFNGQGSDTLEARIVQSDVEFTNVNTLRDDVCLLAFTSGTTGEPKATMHFHRDVLAMCDGFARHILKPEATDLFCGTPPLAFTFGLGGMLCFPLWAGASVLLVERLTPESLLDTIAQAHVSICFTAPTFYRQMALLQRDPATRRDLSSLAKCVSAGEALPDATRQLWKDVSGIEMIDGIGGTEVMHIYISAAPEAVRRGAVGRALPGYEARIVDGNMTPLPVGEVGKLALKGPTGCRYLDDVRQRQYVRDGWNLPGDAFRMDADGYFFYQARTDDMIVSAGYNIAGPEVESALLTHPSVLECGVVGVAHPERGQIVKAFVVLRHDSDACDALALALQNHVKEQIAPYKYPRAVEFVTTLPRTETGKLQRFRLREPG